MHSTSVGSRGLMNKEMLPTFSIKKCPGIDTADVPAVARCTFRTNPNCEVLCIVFDY